MDLEVAWLGGVTIAATGNSFATPHVTELIALVRIRSARAGAELAGQKA